MADNGETKHCPNCKRDISISNFMTHEIHCKRHISLCAHCKEPVPKGEMEVHFEEMHAQIKCPKCGIEVEKSHFEDHEENACPKRPMKCLYCELELPKCDLDNHQDYCGSRTEPCVKCGQYIRLKDQIKHEESKCSYPPAPVKQTNGLNTFSGVGFRNNPIFNERETTTNSFNYDEVNQILTDPAAGLRPRQSKLPGFVGASGSPMARFNGKKTIVNELTSKVNEENSKSIAGNKSYLNRQRELASHSSPGFEMDRLLAMHLQNDFSDSEGDIPDRFPFMEKSEALFPPYMPGFNHSSSNNLNIFSEDMSLIPCEFCFQPYPADDLVLHQSACGHDVIGPQLPRAVADDHSNNHHDNRTEHLPASPRQQPTIIDNLGRLSTDEPYPEIDPFHIDNTEMDAPHGEMLPCEFCDELFPVDILVHHQALCDKNGTTTPRSNTPATRTARPKKLPSIPPSYDIPNMRSHRHQAPPHFQWQEDSTEDQINSRSSRNKMSSNVINSTGSLRNTEGNPSSFRPKYGGKYERRDRDHGTSNQQSFGQSSNVERESTRAGPARMRQSGSNTKISALDSLLKESSGIQSTHDLLGHVSSVRKNKKNDMNSLRQNIVPLGVKGTNNAMMAGNMERDQERYRSRETPGTQTRTSRTTGALHDDGDGPNSRPQRNMNVFTNNRDLGAPTYKRPSRKRHDAPQ